MRHSEEYWALGLNKPGEVQCAAHLKSKPGERCPRPALLGTSVCKMHGGHIPAVRAAAATRIGMSLDDAVKRLQHMLDDPKVEARDKIKIIHDLLDRGDMAATSKVLVGVVTEDPIERLFRDILTNPRGLGDTTVVQLSAAPERDTAQEDYERRRAGRDFIGEDDDYEIVEAEIVSDRPPHTIYIGEAPPTPKHIREAMKRLL